MFPAGACVSSLAIFVSTFSPNVYLLMVGLLFLPLPLSPSYSCCPQISYGVLGGLGLGLMYVPAVTAVGYWFEKKRSLVTGGLLILILLMIPDPDPPFAPAPLPPGISTCGSGFGTIIFAPVVAKLLEVTDWQWTNRIIAGFCLLVSSLPLGLLSLLLPPCQQSSSQSPISAPSSFLIR